MIPMERFIGNARQEHKTFVVCVALYSNTPYIGWNSTKTSPHFKKVYPDGNVSYTRHAEVHALSKIPHDADRRNVTLYVTRLRANGSYSMARPCKACQAAIQEAGVRDVFYTNWEGEWEKLDAN